MPSEAIEMFTYDPLSRTLFVKFVAGDLYAYADVEPETHEAMRRAISKGRFFAKRIRGRYAYGKVEDPSAVRFKPAHSPAP